MNSNTIQTALSLVLISIVSSSFSQIYNSEKVYVYQYTWKTGDKVEEGKMYLGCLNKIYNKRQKQIVWTDKLSRLKQKVMSTGVIENENRVWLHPPRFDRFTILEYTPFPAIKLPPTVNKSWKWELEIGSNWINKEFNMTGDETLSYRYKIVSLKEYPILFTSLPQNKVQCYKVEAVSLKDINQTKWEGLFNEQYGFIEQTFTNIDGSVLIFKLIKISSWDKFTKTPELWEFSQN